MFENFPVLLKKYSVPTLFLALGMGLLYVALSTDQNSIFVLSSVLMMAASILSLLYSSGKLKTSIIYIFGIVAGIAATATLFISYSSVSETKQYNADYAHCKTLAIQNLTDIRSAQKAFAEKNKRYAKDWAELEDFIINGTVPYVIAEGSVPGRKMTQAESKFVYKDNRPVDNNMTEKEALILAKSAMCPEDLKGFKRDTIQVSILETKFGNKSYIESRQKNGFGKFDAKSLKYIPMTNPKKMWDMKVVDSVAMGPDFFPAIEVKGKIPFAKIQGTADEELTFGKTTTNDTGGNWENN